MALDPGLKSPELSDPEKVSSTWIKYFYGLVERLNDTKTQMTGMKQKDVIELKKVPLLDNYPPEDTLPKDRLYRYLLQTQRRTRRTTSKSNE